MKIIVWLCCMLLMLSACEQMLPGPILSSDEAATFKTLMQALNAGNVDEAMRYVADDAWFKLVPPGPDGKDTYTGRDEIQARYREVVGLHAAHTFKDCKTEGETVTCTVGYIDDSLKPLKLTEIEMIAEAVMHNGKMQSATWTITPESLEKLMAAVQAAQAAQPAATPAP